jgi:DNA-directed RNA polymerase beta subunit
MPIIDLGNGKQAHAEVVMNPYSTINRKIPAILMETGLSCCAMRIHDMVDELKKTPAGRKQILPTLEKFYGKRYSNMTVTEFIRLHNTKPIEDVYNFNVGSYSKITPAQVQGYMEELGIPTETKIKIPEADVTDWKELESLLTPEELEKAKLDMTGRFVDIEKPLSYGYVYLERLYHQPQYSSKVVSDLEDVSSRGKQPIAGRGLYRQHGGQKISEMDVWALLSRNAKPFIGKARSSQDREIQQRFLDNILGLGLMVTDKKGYGQGGSNLKSSLQALREKLKIKNNLKN